MNYSMVFLFYLELILEILDFGYPQNSDTDTLKMYITTESIKSERAVVTSPPESTMINASERRFLTNHYASNRRYVLSTQRYKVPSQRSIRRRNRKREPSHVVHRFPACSSS